MGFPIDNIFWMYFLYYWPVLLAIIVTILLFYQWSRPKVSLEKVQKGIIKQNIIQILDDEIEIEEASMYRDWKETKQQIEKYIRRTKVMGENLSPQISYQSYITISLIWTLFWIGVDTFLLIRICFNPYYYGNEAICVGCFTYYIIIGLISYFRR
ncbi:MAG: hypothetical protein ACTSYB_01535 [Candidatus Helarchaeota archaeon]